MAKRWRNMSESERTEWVTAYTSAVGAVLTTFSTDGAEWDAFLVYVDSIGDHLTPVNTLSAFGQHRAMNVAKVSDLRTWSEWVSVGRAPRKGRKVSVFNGFPLHLWDVADTDVTDRKAWRKAPAIESHGNGDAVKLAVAEMVWQSFGIMVGVPAVTPALELDEPTPAERERARLRAEGYKGSLDSMMREEWRAECDRLHDVCEAAIRGAWLNKRGEAKVTDTRAMFRNSVQVKAYGSEELLTWVATNGGVPTFAAYRAQRLGESAPRQSFDDTSRG